MALPRLGSFFSENKVLAGFKLCPVSRSGFFKGFFGGNGTVVEAANAAAVYEIAIDNTAARTASCRRISVLLEGESVIGMWSASSANGVDYDSTGTSVGVDNKLYRKYGFGGRRRQRPPKLIVIVSGGRFSKRVF
jgi:hypothetical protein